MASGGEFHTHAGVIGHDDLIGAVEGATFRSSHGSPFLAIRPTLADFVLKMPRGAQVIYPKDLGPILMLADIFPGARVLESGVGSGALSMTLVRAGAVVTGYELREDFARRAQRNVDHVPGRGCARATTGSRSVTPTRASTRSTSTGSCSTCPSRGGVAKHAARAMHRGGVLVAYTPQITQAVQLRDELLGNGFGMVDTIEVLNRGWHIEGQSVRPDHRMVAHTGLPDERPAPELTADGGRQPLGSERG